MSNAKPTPFDAWAEIVRQSDEQQKELATLSMEARYRADVATYGSEEGAMRAATVRARDAILLTEKARNLSEEAS